MIRIRRMCGLGTALAGIFSIWTAAAAVAQGEDCTPHWDVDLLGSGLQAAKAPAASAMQVYDDGTGGALYIGGSFAEANGIPAANIVRWDGNTWSPLDTGITGDGPLVAVRAMQVYDDGTGPALYVGGIFTEAGGIPAANVARWDGMTWTALGAGTDGPHWPTFGGVRAMAVYDDGTGPALYVGGDFTLAGGLQATYIARWDGQQWSSVGGGMSGGVTPHPPIVRALAVFDDGAGPALYAAGSFSIAGGQPAGRIARWDGDAWSALAGGGVGGDCAVGYDCHFATALLASDDDGQPVLYAAGRFTHAGGITVNQVARWNGLQWSALGDGVGDNIQSSANALGVFDDGAGGGPQLVLGNPSFLDLRGVARWDGQLWSSLGEGTGGTVSSFAVFDDGTGSGPALYVGGRFSAVGDPPLPANSIAIWRGCPDPGNDGVFRPIDKVPLP